jgi:hypothetical protein
MECGEEAIEVMARVMHDELKKRGSVVSNWDNLEDAVKQRWLESAAHAHMAYHDRYDELSHTRATHYY